MKKKLFLPVLAGALFFCIIINNASADFSGISVGDTWTYRNTVTYGEGSIVNNFNVKVKSVSSNTVIADIYANGYLSIPDLVISQVYIYDDAIVISNANLYGTFDAVYGGRTLTVYEVDLSFVRYVVDTATGIMVENVIPDSISLILTSWNGNKESISGVSWFSTVLVIIGISAYFIRRRWYRIYK